MPVARLKDLKHIPGTSGLPYFGDLFPYLKDATGYFKRKQKKYGDVFRTTTPFSTAVTLIGPTANRLILIEESKFASNKEAWEVALEKLFPNGLMLMDGEKHRYHRNIMNEAFKKDPMQGYLDMMPDTIERELTKLEGKTEIKFFPFIKEMTLTLATKVFFGMEVDEDIPQIYRAFTDIVNAALAIPINLPFTKFGKGLRARSYLVKYFSSAIAKKRQNPGKDLFSRLCVAKSEEGDQFTDQEIIDHLIFVLMAAHDTTAITLSMMTYFLALHPEWQEVCRKEAIQLNNIDKPTAIDLRKMVKTGLVIKETLRLHPPLISVGRKLEKEMNVEGHMLPKNTLVQLVMQMTHIDERVWSDPESFDPERFSKVRSEHTKCPYAYAPFGAGKHHCIGFAFAEMQIKLIMSQILRKHHLSVPPGYICPIADVPLKHPKDGLPIKLSSNI